MSPSILDIQVTCKWVRINDLYSCKRCKRSHSGYGYQLSITTQGIHNSTTSIGDVILCPPCHKHVNDNL